MLVQNHHYSDNDSYSNSDNGQQSSSPVLPVKQNVELPFRIPFSCFTWAVFPQDNVKIGREFEITVQMHVVHRILILTIVVCIMTHVKHTSGQVQGPIDVTLSLSPVPVDKKISDLVFSNKNVSWRIQALPNTG